MSPLVRIDEDDLSQIERGRFPRYAFVEGVAGDGLVADLDRVMTVEKSVVASWSRTPGCTDDGQRRDLARALARKRSRFAFPDEFTRLARRLQDRLKQKHGKESPEGRALRALREIRVRAAPSWDADEVEIFIWFIIDDGIGYKEGRPDEHLERWLDLIPASGRFQSIDGVVTSLDDLTARDYVEGDPLDLDHLSLPIDA